MRILDNKSIAIASDNLFIIDTRKETNTLNLPLECCYSKLLLGISFNESH